jgi:uncharacterized protein YegL
LVKTSEKLLKQGARSIQIGVVAFGSKARPVCELTRDLEDIRTKVSSIGISGSTAMDEGIACAARMLRGGPAGSSCEIALVTDGMPDDEDDALEAAETARQSGIRISAVGIGFDDVDGAFLKRIASGVLLVEDARELDSALPNLLMQDSRDKEKAITWASSRE